MFYVFFIQCLDSLLSVLVKEMGPERKNMEAVQVAERFVRSVVRVFTVCHTESVCVPSGSLVTTTSSSARRKRSVQTFPFLKIIREFASYRGLSKPLILILCTEIWKS